MTEQLGVDTQQCVFVGHGGSEKQHGARARGMTPLWLTRHLKEDTITRLQPKLRDKIVKICFSLDELALGYPDNYTEQGPR